MNTPAATTCASPLLFLVLTACAGGTNSPPNAPPPGAISAATGATTSTPAPKTLGVGPRVPVGPQASLACPPGAVMFSPGTNAQDVVNANPPGTTYCFTSGSYLQQQIIPKSGDSYFGFKGATLDGKDISTHAFSGSASAVTIQNLVIEDYNTPIQYGAIDSGSNWIIKNNELSDNAAAGVAAYNGTAVVANYIHDNNEEGYKAFGSNVSYTDNEISHNNPNDEVDPSWEAGGGKAWATTNLIIEYNYSHDNHGPGLWSDYNNQGTVYEHNDVDDNWQGGIKHEISWNAIVAYNVVTNNSSSKYCTGVSIWCDNVVVANSGGVAGGIVDVHNNILASNGPTSGGVGLLSETRGSGTYGTWLVQNVRVHNNQVDLSAGGTTGALVDAGAVSGKGNSFQGDAYRGASSNSFWWNGGIGSFSFFQSQGQDTTGTSQ